MQNNHWSDRLAGRLSRVTSGKAFVPEIDGLRFFAIGTVILYHLGTTLKRAEKGLEQDDLSFILGKGGLGVDVFFAISGFVLALPFAYHYLNKGKAVDLKSYFVRRLTRLEPPYIIALLVLFVAHILLKTDTPAALFPHLMASIFYIHSFVYDKWSVINPVAWSLEVEVQFYILAPVMALLFQIRNAAVRRSILIMLIVVASVCSIHFLPFIKEWHLRKSILVYIHLFLSGFLFADFYVAQANYFGQKANSWLIDLVGIMGVVLLYTCRSFSEPVLQLGFSLGIILMFWAAFKGKFFNAFYSNRWIAIIGGMCYTLYLLHYPITKACIYYTHTISVSNSLGISILLQALIVVPVVLLIAAIYFIFIEKPCMYKDWPQRLMAYLKK